MEGQAAPSAIVGEHGEGDLSGIRLADELAESNRRISQLLEALQEEKKRITRAEEALTKPLQVASIEQNSAPPPPPLSEIYASTLGLQESDILGAYKPVKPPYQSQQRLHEERSRFRSMPSVVTWFPMGKVHASTHGEGTEDYSFQDETVNQKTEEIADVDVDCEELQQLREHESHVWCCAFHPDVPMIATGSSDKTVRLWRTDGECVRVLRGHKEWVYCLAFSPMGDVLCSGSFDGTLRLWTVSVYVTPVSVCLYMWFLYRRCSVGENKKLRVACSLCDVSYGVPFTFVSMAERKTESACVTFTSPNAVRYLCWLVYLLYLRHTCTHFVCMSYVYVCTHIYTYR
jgi:WD40 repeat protein